MEEEEKIEGDDKEKKGKKMFFFSEVEPVTTEIKVKCIVVL